VDLAGPLLPLLRRAEATASLQGRQWHGPANLPSWRGDSGSVAEILANLLENAFRYSPGGCPLGLHCGVGASGGPTLSVWDGGEAIDADERQTIFERGKRGRRGLPLPGTGIGLDLARELARGLGGELELVIPPYDIDSSLPKGGNAFRLSLPPQATDQPIHNLQAPST
jgi:signal transduction histidine kinase